MSIFEKIKVLFLSSILWLPLCPAWAQSPESQTNDFLNALHSHEENASYELVTSAYEVAVTKASRGKDSSIIQLARLCYYQKNLEMIRNLNVAQKNKFDAWLVKENNRLDSIQDPLPWAESIYKIALMRLKLSQHPMWAEMLKNPNQPLIKKDEVTFLQEEMRNLRHPQLLIEDEMSLKTEQFNTEDIILLEWAYFYTLHAHQMQRVLKMEGASSIPDIEQKFFEVLKAYAQNKSFFDAPSVTGNIQPIGTQNSLLNIEVKIAQMKSVEQYVKESFSEEAWHAFQAPIQKINPEIQVSTPFEQETIVLLPLKLWLSYPAKSEMEQIEEQEKASMKSTDEVAPQNENKQEENKQEENTIEEEAKLVEEETTAVHLEEEAPATDSQTDESKLSEGKTDADEKKQSIEEEEKSVEDKIKDSFKKEALDSQPEHADQIEQHMDDLLSKEGAEGQESLLAKYSPAYTPLYLRTFNEVRALPEGLISEPDLDKDPELEPNEATVTEIEQVASLGHTILLVPSEGAFKTFLLDASRRPEFNGQNQSYSFSDKAVVNAQSMATYQVYGQGIPKQSKSLATYEHNLYANSVYFGTGGLTKEDVPTVLRKKIEELFQNKSKSIEEKLSALALIVRGIIEYDKKLNQRPALVKQARATGVPAHRLLLQELKVEESANGGLRILSKPFGVCDSYAEIFVQFVRLFAQGQNAMPSRVAIGFMAQKGVVIGSQAHAWAEVYFHNKGWVRFEATGGPSRDNGNGGDNAALESLPGEAPFDSLANENSNLDFDMIQPPRGDSDDEFGNSHGGELGQGGGFLGGARFGNNRSNPEEEQRRAKAGKFIDDVLPTLTWTDIRKDQTLQARIQEVRKYYSWELKVELLSISLGGASDWKDLLFWSLSFLSKLSSPSKILAEWFLKRALEHGSEINRNTWHEFIDRLEEGAQSFSAGRGLVLYSNFLGAIPGSQWVSINPSVFIDLFLELLARFEVQGQSAVEAQKNDSLLSFYRALLFFSQNHLIMKNQFLDLSEKMIRLDMTFNPDANNGNAGVILDVYYQNAGDRMISFMTKPIDAHDSRLPLFYDASYRFSEGILLFLKKPQVRAMSQIVQGDYLAQWTQRTVTGIHLYQEAMALQFLFRMDKVQYEKTNQEVDAQKYIVRLDLLKRLLSHEHILASPLLLSQVLDSFEPHAISSQMPTEHMTSYANVVLNILGAWEKDQPNSYKMIILMQKLIQAAKEYPTIPLFASIETLGQWLTRDSLQIVIPIETELHESVLKALSEISAYYLEHTEGKGLAWGQWFIRFQTQNPNITASSMIREMMSYIPVGERRNISELLWTQVKESK